MNLKLLFGIFVFLFSFFAQAECSYSLVRSSYPVRSNKNIFVGTFKVSCTKRIYFETAVSNTEIKDSVKSLVYVNQSPHYDAALREHDRAQLWSVLKYTRPEIEEILGGMSDSVIE